MPKNPKAKANKKAAGYVIDMNPGNHSYVFAEGVGECRANFMRMVEGIDTGEVDVLIVAKAELLFIDTAPLWMEKFIATVKRHHILVADAERNKDYDLQNPTDEAAFRELGKN